MVNHIKNFPSSRINNRGIVRIHYHSAKKLLELDVAAGDADGVKPEQSKETRDEYKDLECTMEHSST